MSSKPKTNPKPETQEIPSEIEFLNKFRCVEERKFKEKGKERDYTVYNCTATLITKDNLAQVIEQALNTATQLNAVIRIFRIVESDAVHTVSLTITRGGYVAFEVRFPQRVAGFQNVLSVRINEVGILKQIADKLADLVQNLIP